MSAEPPSGRITGESGTAPYTNDSIRTQPSEIRRLNNPKW
jgi:hypothetical protein